MLELIQERMGGRVAALPELQELARHHAFDMATRNFRTDVDPEGVDHAERRRRLHPELVGLSQQVIGEFAPRAELSPEAFAAEEADGVLQDLSDDGWTNLGLGVAVEEGRGRICLVVAQPWARLTKKPSWGPDAGWEVEGTVTAGSDRSQLSVRVSDGSGDAPGKPASWEETWDRERFRLQIDVLDPSSEPWIEILRNGVPGLRRRTT